MADGRDPLQKALAEMSERDLLARVVAPLFRTMGFDSVQLAGGPFEAGRDIVMWRPDALGRRQASVAQVKSIRLSAKASASTSLGHILAQLQQALEIPVRTPDGREHTAHEVFFITPHDIPPSVLDAVSGHLKRLGGRVTVVDGSMLADLLKRYAPELSTSIMRGIGPAREVEPPPSGGVSQPSLVGTARATQALEVLSGIYFELSSFMGLEEAGDPSLCFVIMSFSKDGRLEDFYDEAIKPTIESLGFRCERVDEQQFNGRIMERVFRNIRQARFVVADLTEARQNCYYELGVAHALKKDVIHLASSTQDLHFDVKDYNFIIYSRINQLADALRERILATIGRVGGQAE